MHQDKSLKDLILKALEDIQAEDIRELDVADFSDITDFMIIATGRSDRHVRAVADSVMEDLLEQGIKPIGKEGFETAEWVLLDYGDVVTHIMRKETREFYDLESLWGEQVRELVKKTRENPLD